ncbi:MAG: MFS transporter [Alphaproteobacteria bacterium]|nr:MFS transporter [Alphaproteobacteria bacterium]
MTPERGAHPVLFLVLFLPMGITNGYVVVTLGYLLTHAGVDAVAVAGLVSVSLLPQTWKFFWAPVVDTTLTTKRWYLYSSLVIGVLMIGTSIIAQPATHLMLVGTLVFGFSLASTFNMMAADSLMAHATKPEEKGRAGGWSQAGNLGGSGLGGGAGLWLAQHVAGAWVVGAALGAACIISSLALLPLREPEAEHRVPNYLETLKNVGTDVWSILRSRMGFLAFVAMCLPIGAGAAQNLWAAVAGDWHASADTVALINGALGGVISMIGCVIGGYFCDRMDRKTAFNLFSIVLALSAAAMAITARTEAMFVVFTCVYAFILGFCFAAFGAVVLEAIGAGAAATKYNLLAGIANAPIIYLTMIDGWAHKHWGADGFLLAEALVPVAGTCVFILIALVTRRFFRQSAAA